MEIGRNDLTKVSGSRCHGIMGRRKWVLLAETIVPWQVPSVANHSNDSPPKSQIARNPRFFGSILRHHSPLHRSDSTMSEKHPLQTFVPLEIVLEAEAVRDKKNA